MVHISDKEIEWREGITLQEVIENLQVERISFLLELNHVIIPRDKWDTTQVPNNARIKIIPMIAGG